MNIQFIVYALSISLYKKVHPKYRPAHRQSLKVRELVTTWPPFSSAPHRENVP